MVSFSDCCAYIRQTIKNIYRYLKRVDATTSYVDIKNPAVNIKNRQVLYSINWEHTELSLYAAGGSNNLNCLNIIFQFLKEKTKHLSMKKKLNFYFGNVPCPMSDNQFPHTNNSWTNTVHPYLHNFGKNLIGILTWIQ